MIFKIIKDPNSKIEQMFIKAMAELNEFFGFNWKRNIPKLFLVPDRKTINALHEKETPEWNIGWVQGKDVCILHYENFEKNSNHSYSDEKYFKLIKHELAHAFTNLKFSAGPKWLWEGIAIYLSGQIEHKTKPKKFSDFLNYHEHGRVEGVYRESGFAVEFLIETYGKEKLFELLKILKENETREEFTNKFRQIYGFDLKYKNFKILGDCEER